MNPNELPNYRWPDLSKVVRQFLVRDDTGRVGIARSGPDNDLWSRPADVNDIILASPDGVQYMTNTLWHYDGAGWVGTWFDQPVEDRRRLTIVNDLGWRMPDKYADQALVGSDQMGYWNYGAMLGRVGGQPPVAGQKPGECTIAEAVDYTAEVGEPVSARGLRLACARGYIPSARKAGRDWLLSYESINHYLDNRPRPGRKPGD